MNRENATRIFCYKCGDKTHNTKDCASGERVCFNCKKPGHEAKKCALPRGILLRKCHVCGQTGHMQSQCIWRQCLKCEEVGHTARECTNSKKSEFKRKCFKCDGTDHITRHCLAHRPSSTDDQRKSPTGAQSKATHAEKNNDNSKPEQSKPETCKSEKSKPEKRKSETEKREYIPRTPTPPPSARSAEKARQDADRENLQSANDWKEKGNVAFRQDDFDYALACYTRSIQIYPEGSIFYGNRAAVYVAQNQFQLALWDCQRAITLQDSSPTAKIYVRSARCHYALGSVMPAFASLRQALEIEPEHAVAKTFRVKALALQGHIRDFEGARSRGHWRMAQTACDSCIRAIVDEGGVIPPEWKCWKIELQIARGEWEEATAAIDCEMANVSARADLMLLHGTILFLSGKLDEAMERLAAASKFDPDSSKIKLLRLRVKNTRSLKEDGNTFFRNERWTMAIEKYGEALEVIGEDINEGRGGRIRAVLLSNRAASYVKLKRSREAMVDIKASLLLCPSSFKALRTSGLINLLEENYEAAIEDFKHAIEVADTESEKKVVESLLQHAETQALSFSKRPKDHYKTLDLKRGCTEAQIKKAYRQASLKHHPDKGGSEAKFKIIAEAYGILSDPVERRSYDAKSGSCYSGYESDEDRDDDYHEPNFGTNRKGSYPW